MRVSYALDSEQGLNPLDPLGELLFSSESGAAICIKITYVDAWLYELLTGVNKLLINGDTVISVAEEPNVLVMTLSRPNLVLQWDGAEIIGNANELFASLRSESYRFIEELKLMPDWEKNPAIIEIEKLLESSSFQTST